MAETIAREEILEEMNYDVKVEEWAVLLTGESLLFGLLGKVFYTQPKADWLGVLLEADPFSDVPFAESDPYVLKGLAFLQAWQEALPEDLDDKVVRDLQADHTRLFTGAGIVPVAPWASVYRHDGQLVFQPETLQVRAWYRRFGLEAIDRLQEPDDHIGMEMSFLAHLAQLGVAALEESDVAALGQVLDAQRSFLTDHMLRWVPAWCVDIDTFAMTDFYRGMAYLARGGLRALAALLGLRFPD